MRRSADMESVRRQFASLFDGIQLSSKIPYNIAKEISDLLNIESLRSQVASQFDGTEQSSMISCDINGEMLGLWFVEEVKRELASRSHRSGQYSRVSFDIQDRLIARRNRSERMGDARLLPRPLTYDYNSKTCLNQKNTCIWSGGAHSWTEALSGIMWVAVHGMDTICVVTRIKDLEQEITLRVAMLKSKPERLLCIFTHGLIGKVEDFVDTSSIQHRLLHQIIKKPFGVVSVIPDTKIVRTVSGHEASSAKYDEENAIKFLQNEMESGTAFTYDKTVQTAICALDHLFHQRFKANEIMVFVWKKDGGGQAKALPHVREELDVEEHLAAINNPDR